ncbi:uncharacterized protein LOC129306216 isoform X2 [Prosopis cineraria]|uniref:uncharacterized protein LOC129306216 isoform X2 n=1 Tax=Prosopis cineraria TaxID=364024 RepID=UPI0024107DB6|nr:uncharacterized protein LOC129306216 isoform X2 [Prosopis cineraria]
MASFWSLELLLKCIDFLSWPVLALVYPLCASVEAIENDSHSDTRNLISYWILLSLIYLFEYAFLQLLQWIPYWHYVKLAIVVYLVMPDFGRAAYVYNHLIRSCLYMNPQAVISRFSDWKKIFVEKEDFLMQAEKYITQNGTEGLEKLIVSKSTEKSPNAETRKAVPSTEKNEILKTNRGRLHMEQKDIKDLEMIEKEEVSEVKQANTALCSLESNESTSSSTVKTQKMAADKEGGAYPQISALENVQKEWTCAICQLTMPSEANLNSHLQGRKHKMACEALKAKKTEGNAAATGTGNGASHQSCLSNVQKEWTCNICQVRTTSEANLNAHLQGKQHKAAFEAQKAKSLNVAEKVLLKKNDKSNGEQEKIMNTSNASEQNITTSHHPKMEHKNVQTVNIIQGNKSKGFDPKTKVQELQKSTGTSIEINSSRLRCDMCNVKCTSEVDLASHFRGRKHLAQSQILSGPS